MKHDKGFNTKVSKPIIDPKYVPRFHSHVRCQIVTTILCVATSVSAFLFSALLQTQLLRLGANFEGPLSNEDRPCARRVLAECSAAADDTCRPECCPQGYVCYRDPTVGLYCQERDVACGNFNLCLDVADMPGTCERPACQGRTMAEKMTYVLFVVAAGAVVMDFIDLLTCMVASDSVLLKTLANFVACLAKLLTFGCIIGVGVGDYLSEVGGALCYNDSGMLTVWQARQAFVGAATTSFFSFLLSLCLIPISALHGGRLQQSPPMHRMRSMEIGA